MIWYLTTRPLWLSGLLLVGVTTVLSVFGPILVRRHVALEQLSTNNEVAGFKFATVGVLYAVLLAFAVIVVWERFATAESDVTHEAGAAATIYRISRGLEGEPAEALRAGLTSYIETAIASDWPAMELGGDSKAAQQKLDALYATLLTLASSQRRETMLTTEILHQLDVITASRRARLIAAKAPCRV
jgi:hypothetical protein